MRRISFLLERNHRLPEPRQRDHRRGQARPCHDGRTADCCLKSVCAARRPLGSLQAHYGPTGDPRSSSRRAHRAPSIRALPQRVVDRALEEDSAKNTAEYLAEFRSDIEIVRADRSRRVLPRRLSRARPAGELLTTRPSGPQRRFGPGQLHPRDRASRPGEARRHRRSARTFVLRSRPRP